jgi:hypothetical protein
MLRPSGFQPLRRALAGAAMSAFVVTTSGSAFAQVPAECQKGIELFKARISWIQKIQALPKKAADPGVACTLFTKLGAANATVLAWSKSNKDWCSIEDNQITGLENEAKQVAGIRAKACTVAAQYKKLKDQALHQAQQNREDNAFSVDMHADPLAPPVKIPPSAL